MTTNKEKYKLTSRYNDLIYNERKILYRLETKLRLCKEKVKNLEEEKEILKGL